MTDDTLTVNLSDGRSISVPLAWYPRLLHGTPEERVHWRLIGQGDGLHWPDLDEDISVRNLLEGKSSGESQRSFRAWLDRRAGNSVSPHNSQSLLPENLETITISSLMEDESVYVTPWVIVADYEGRLWIQGHGLFTREPNGTSCVRITRSGEFIIVDKNTIANHTYQRSSVHNNNELLPVVLR